MEQDFLVNCTIKFLQLLIDQYKSDKITYEFFDTNSELKIKFLKDSLCKIQSSKQKQQAISILEACELIAVRNQLPL
jgi:hypothetical protein